MTQKHILFVTHLFHPACGGVEIHLKRLSKGFIDLGFEVSVLTTNAYSTEAFFLNDKRRIDNPREILDGIAVERLGFHTFGRRTLNALRHIACRIKYPMNNRIRPLSYGPRNRRFYNRILEIKPDLILAAPLPTYNIFYAWKGAKKLKVPLIVIPSYHIHDPCSFSNPLFFRIMRDADLVMAQSRMESDYLQAHGDIPADSLVIFPPLPLSKTDLAETASSPKKDTLREKYGIIGKRVILYLGQHGRHKNIEPVIKAMPFVWDVDRSVALVIAGGTTQHTPNLKSLAGNLQKDSDGRIYFIDNFPLEEKKDIFDMADIFVCLSEFESFGIVFVEALAHGLPILASCHGVAGSIVENFKTGLLVNPYCDVEVAGALIELLQDGETREVYGANGRRVALERYDPEAVLKQWEERLKNLL